MYLIYRSWDQGLLGKRVRRLPEPTVLEWVRRVWYTVPPGIADLRDGPCPPGAPDDRDAEAEAARSALRQMLAAELGGDVYGLDTLFWRGGPPPRTMEELRTLARGQLPDTEECNADERSLRVLAYSTRYEVAYYLVDDAAVAAEPARWAFALHEGPLPDAPSPLDPLPDAPSLSGLPHEPAFVPPVTPVPLVPGSPEGGGATYAVLLTFRALHDSVGRDLPYVLPGVRLPRLGAALREIGAQDEQWPLELRVLRALVGPDEDGIGPALERCNHWPGYSQVEEDPSPWPASHEEALRVIESAPRQEGRDPGRTVIRVGEHAAEMSLYNGFEDFEQWFFFDDVWAAAHPHLACSLVSFAYHWDLLCSRPHGLWPPCADNRVRYLAVEGDDGEVEVRLERLGDEEAVGAFMERVTAGRRAPGEVPGDVVGLVEVRVRQAGPDEFAFREFVIRRRRGVREVVTALAGRLRADLVAAGMVRATGWLPWDYPHGPAFLRALGEVTRPGPSRLPELRLL
ncbi:hypothetical protein AB0L05_12255 [Nonomuraea pusilla]|uniref:hypothetical protein n=1 Tax=Nonomuraea pusilla TaxID=46177 RepID=UPI00332CE21A